MGELIGYADQITSYGFSSTDLGNKAGAMNSSQNRYRMSCKPDGSIYDRLVQDVPSEALAIFE